MQEAGRGWVFSTSRSRRREGGREGEGKEGSSEKPINTHIADRKSF